jgi:hypothetical protein
MDGLTVPDSGAFQSESNIENWRLYFVNNQVFITHSRTDPINIKYYV